MKMMVMELNKVHVLFLLYTNIQKFKTLMQVLNQKILVNY